jgi:maltokinase
MGSVGHSPTEVSTSWQYPLSFGAAVKVVRSDTPGVWSCRPDSTFSGGTPAWGLSQAEVAAAAQHFGDVGEAGRDGVAEAFVSLLRHQAVPPVPGFRLLRLIPPPEASGERPDASGTDAESRVVVGERVAVTWVDQILDAENVTPLLQSHLDAVDFMSAQETYGALLWTTPNGHEVPVAWARRYLPRARDGWDWCVDLTRQALGLVGPRTPRDPWADDFPARLGALTARLHAALATPSKVLAHPTGQADADQLRAWHAVGRRTLQRAVELAQDDAPPGVAQVLLPRAQALQQAIDAVATMADEWAGDDTTVPVQRIHGDLHVGQVLRWSAGLTVVDFHPDPELGFEDLHVGQVLQSAARDVARLLRSLDHVARVVDKESGFTLTAAVDAWSAHARKQLLDAYAREHSRPAWPDIPHPTTPDAAPTTQIDLRAVVAHGRPQRRRRAQDAVGAAAAAVESAPRRCPVDARLIAAFEAEQLCREIVYACERLPDWVYAPLGGLWQEYPERADEPPRSARHVATS